MLHNIIDKVNPWHWHKKPGVKICLGFPQWKYQGGDWFYHYGRGNKDMNFTSPTPGLLNFKDTVLIVAADGKTVVGGTNTVSASSPSGKGVAAIDASGNLTVSSTVAETVTVVINSVPTVGSPFSTTVTVVFTPVPVAGTQLEFGPGTFS